MNELSLRGLIAPAFFALALGGATLQFFWDATSLHVLTPGFVLLGLAFSGDTRRVFGRGMTALSGGPKAD
jgi:hypothetical protein